MELSRKYRNKSAPMVDLSHAASGEVTKATSDSLRPQPPMPTSTQKKYLIAPQRIQYPLPK